MGKNKQVEKVEKKEVEKKEVKKVKKAEKPVLKKGMVKIYSKESFTILLDHNIYCRASGKCKCKTVKINRRDRKGKIKKTETKRLPDSLHINFGVNIVSEIILKESIVKLYLKQGTITKRR